MKSLISYSCLQICSIFEDKKTSNAKLQCQTHYWCHKNIQQCYHVRPQLVLMTSLPTWEIVCGNIDFSMQKNLWKYLHCLHFANIFTDFNAQLINEQRN